MSHQAFDKLLEQLYGRCLGMAGIVQQQVALAVEAVIRLDVVTAKKVLQTEATIDAEEVEVERQAINLMLLHHPAAQDFRIVFGIVKMNADLERIGDCAVNIAQQVPAIHYAMARTMLETRDAGDHPEVPRDMRLLGEATLKQVQDTVRCLSTREVALAQEIVRADDLVDALNSQIMRDTSAQMEETRGSVPAGLGIILAAKNFERMGDHCTNIAEDILYLMKGEIVRHTHDRV